MDKVLQALLTPKELAEVEKRLQIFHQLEQQVPQREIATSLGVGIATVTRGARALHAGDFPAEVMQTISNKPK